jgi:hypothetical protein
MIYFLALLPATVLTIAGYFVLFLSARSEGALRTFGRYLGFWAFTLAGLIILGALFAAAHGGHHCPVFGMHGMHERMYDSWPAREERRDVGPSTDASRTSPPAPGTPANPTAAPTPPSPAAH